MQGRDVRSVHSCAIAGGSRKMYRGFRVVHTGIFCYHGLLNNISIDARFWKEIFYKLFWL